MTSIWNVLRMFLWLTFLTGIIYPLLITGIGKIGMGNKAEGDFITVDGKIVGAKLIGQKFTSDRYFWSRPSAVDYNPLPSGASNLGPTSAELKKQVEERRKGNAEVPSDLLYASGSGLDPHITLEAAHFQLDRVVQARGWDEQTKQKLEMLIADMSESNGFGFLEAPCVNVLLLNIALDRF